MIAVDTSVWISALRDPHSTDADTLRQLLDADEVVLPVSVRSELLMGVTWHTLDSWTDKAVRNGHTFSLGDLIVGILAADIGALVWSLDKDFERMEKLKLIQLYG